MSETTFGAEWLVANVEDLWIQLSASPVPPGADTDLTLHVTQQGNDGARSGGP